MNYIHARSASVLEVFEVYWCFQQKWLLYTLLLPWIQTGTMTFTVLRNSCTLYTFTVLRQKALAFTLPPPYDRRTSVDCSVRVRSVRYDE